MLQAYADGVNDYAKNIGGSSGLLLPPEFILLGIKEFQAWTPVDTVCIFKLLNFMHSWNWGQDLIRDVLENNLNLDPDLVDQLIPFTSEHSHNLVTIFDKNDLKESSFLSEAENLNDLYKKTRDIKKIQKKNLRNATETV
jgi:acyl-homoserine lactone acylase PvdQ